LYRTLVHHRPRGSGVGCGCEFRARIRLRRGSLDVGLGNEAGIEEFERPQKLRVFLTESTPSLLLSYLHANDLRFWIAVKTTFAVVSFRKRTTRTLLSPMRVA
jgi:hypothetical protein